MDVLHIDDEIIVVDKPAGLPVLPDGWEKGSPYLLRMLEEEYGRISPGSPAHIWVVHRLDKVTSGVMVFARTAHAHRELNRQFETREAEKLYHAVLLGSPQWDEMIARQPLRVNVGHKHRTAVDDRLGKPAETRFRVLTRYRSEVLVEAALMTGRTHQIRAHAHALGCPLLGDVLYGAPESELLGRPALHSHSLTITNPWNEKRETYIAPYPADFAQALQLLGS